jgi:hypothetical protein
VTLRPSQALGWQPNSRAALLAGSSCSSPAGSPYRGGNPQHYDQHSKTLSHVMQQLRERDQELVVLTGELEGLRASNQQLHRAQAAAAGSQAQVAAVQEAERQVQQLQGMVSMRGLMCVCVWVFSSGCVSEMLAPSPGVCSYVSAQACGV